MDTNSSSFKSIAAYVTTIAAITKEIRYLQFAIDIVVDHALCSASVTLALLPLNSDSAIM